MKKITFLLVATMFFVFTGVSRGESYISLYAGGALPNNADWNDNIGIGASGVLDMDNTPVFGVKAGHWFTEANSPFLGLEVEGNVHFPAWNSVTTDHSLGFLLVPPVTRGISADTTLVSVLFNGLMRMPQGPVRPYAGAGIGFAVWDIGDQSLATVGTFRSETDTAFAWDVLAGADFRLNKQLSFFAEYKYFGANFSFPDFIGMDIDYRASLIYGGLIIRF
jgi:opacity protein-like surface antigen